MRNLVWNGSAELNKPLDLQFLPLIRNLHCWELHLVLLRPAPQVDAESSHQSLAHGDRCKSSAKAEDSPSLEGQAVNTISCFWTCNAPTAFLASAVQKSRQHIRWTPPLLNHCLSWPRYGAPTNPNHIIISTFVGILLICFQLLTRYYPPDTFQQ